MRTRRGIAAIAAFLMIAAVAPVADANFPIDPGGGGGLGGGGDVNPNPTPTASVTLFASCQRTSSAGLTVWFGYDNVRDTAIDAAIGTTNRVSTDPAGAGDNRGQVTQFRAGRTERAWALTVPLGSTVTWTVVSPSVEQYTPDEVSSATAFNTANTPVCVGSTPVRSAAPQMAPFTGLVVTPERQVRNSAGQLIRATVRFSLPGITSGCSDGGVPLPPVILWGDGGPSSRANQQFLPQPGPAFAPLPPASIVRTDVFTTPAGVEFPFTRTHRSVRAVVDPQLGTSFAMTDLEALYFPVAVGWSSQLVIADVVARCKFGNTVVRSATTLIWPSNGKNDDAHVVTDVATQSTRAPNLCLISLLIVAPGANAGCDLVTNGDSGGGGASFRR